MQFLRFRAGAVRRGSQQHRVLWLRLVLPQRQRAVSRSRPNDVDTLMKRSVTPWEVSGKTPPKEDIITLQSPRFKREDAYICSRTPMCVVEFGPPPLADAAWHVALFCLQAHAWSSRKRPREAKGRTHVIRKRRTKWGPGTSICIGHMLLFPLLAFRGNLSLLEIFYI